MSRILDHFYLLGAIALAVYSQCIIRWQMSIAQDIPSDFIPKMKFVVGLLLQPWVISSIMATFFAGLLWMAALSKFELNYAYPWMALIFLSMTFMGAIVFGESLSVLKIAGTGLIVLGLVLVARG